MPKRRKRCHTCRTFIDLNKEFNFLDRPFCSRRCVLRALEQEFIRIFPLKRLKFRILSLLLPYFLHFITLLLIGFLWFTRENSDISAPTRVIDHNQQTDSTALLKDLPDAIVHSNSIDIAGEADNNLILSLSVNEKLATVTKPENNSFKFADIPLEYGENEIIVRAINLSGKVVMLEKLKTTFGSPKLDLLAREISRGDINESKIALTFDGGSGNGAADSILHILQGRNVKCTIFLTGQFIKRYPNLVKKMISDGHEIANHTWSHPHLTDFALTGKHRTLPKVTRKFLHQQLEKTANYFNKITGQTMAPYWRAPFGEHNLQIRRWAAELGYRHVSWTIGNNESLDTMDWVADTTLAHYKTNDEILSSILEFQNDKPQQVNGGIILMHLDTNRDHEKPYKVIPTLIDSLTQRGYTLVKISKLDNQ